MRRHSTRGLCPVCKGPVITGEDSDVAAVMVRVDGLPLGPQGEALAQLAGRSTYALIRRGPHLDLHLRDHWQIAGTPAGERRPGGLQADVLAEHRCQADPLPSVPSVLTRSRPPKETRLDPPF